MAQLAKTANVGDTKQRDLMIARQLKKVGLIEGRAGQYKPVENVDNRDLTAIVQYLNHRYEVVNCCGIANTDRLETCILERFVR